MNGQKILVTGGAGFIGSHLTAALVKTGSHVVVYDNLSTGRPENVPPGAVLIRADMLDLTRLQLAVAEADIVVHLAARVSIRASMDGFYEDAETNLMGTVNLLRALRGSHVAKLVFASSMAVYADMDGRPSLKETDTTEPISAYGISKLAAEKYMLLLGGTLGIKVAVLRFFNTYGPGQRYTPYVGVVTIFINRLLNNEPITIYGTGEQRRDFVSVYDVVRCTIAAMKWQGDAGIFNVGSGKATSVNELADMIIRKLAPGAKAVHQAEQTGEIKNSIADISHARATLGYQPSDRLPDFIDAIIAAQKANPTA